MSDSIKHECAVTLLRLRKDQSYYLRKYGTSLYGYQKLALLLEKQHNRGQDGAGIACLQLNPVPGNPAYAVEKSNASTALADLLGRIGRTVPSESFSGNLYLGHLRYGTFGNGSLEACHPFIRNNSYLNRTLLFAGNFNLTDTADIFRKLVDMGHHPASKADGYLILHLLGHYLDKSMDDGLGIAEALRMAASELDGAFTVCGMTGDGIGFALRDAAGIRPGFFYVDDEVAVVSSERPAIQAAFNCATSDVCELPPGKAMIIDRDGAIDIRECLQPVEPRKCVFERIYFSRANDADIHQERKALGRALIPKILTAVDNDFDNTLFSYIPNTAQICFHGMLESLFVKSFAVGKQTRFGQIAIKDAKFRTFIADSASRKELYMHVYDVTYGLVRKGSDNLVVLDDSIVRGNTIRNAILPILDRLGPKKIVVASSAPPIKYPDCYGIDMATMHELVAFEAAVDLLNKHGLRNIIDECYQEAKRQLAGPVLKMTNCVRPIYDAFSEEELERAITDRLRPKDLHADLEVVFQTCEDLVKCCPGHRGDWYFTGNYPTSGGFKVVNQALVNYVEHNNERAY